MHFLQLKLMGIFHLVERFYIPSNDPLEIYILDLDVAEVHARLDSEFSNQASRC